MSTHELHRREVLLAGAAAGAVLAFPRLARADESEAKKARTLVLIHLNGGNDGLNTVVPAGEPAYRRYRPSLALDGGELHALDDDLGLHPGLNGFAEQWRKGRLAVINGVGYPAPSYSHFRATEIWHTAQPDKTPTLGWLGRALEAKESAQPLRAIALTKEQPLSLVSSAPGAVNMTDFSRFALPQELREASKLYEAYAKMGDLRGEVGKAAVQSLDVAAKIARLRPSDGSYYGALGDRLRRAMALLRADLDLEIIQLELGGFDTHAGQRGAHQGLLSQLGNNLNSFQEHLERLGLAEQVVTVVFSEFGRRVAENASGGTDHGSAGPVFVMGKGIKGGLYGDHPSLTDLDNGNLRYTVDFRRIYAAILRDGMQIAPEKVLGDFEPLPLFA